MFKILLVIILTKCQTKHILIKTKPINGASRKVATSVSDMSAYDDARDYSADVQTKTVNMGDPFDLKCTSLNEIRACYFARGDGNTIYRVKKGATFEQNRLQPLSDVSYPAH